MISIPQSDYSLNSISEIDTKANEIINHIKQTDKLWDDPDIVLDFLNEYLADCKDLIMKSQYKECLYTLIKLNDICLKAILYRPKDLILEMKVILQDIEDLIIASNDKKNDKLPIDGDILIKNLKHLQKEMNINNKFNRDSMSSFYTVIIENLCDIINNIGVIYHKRERIDKCLYYFNLAANILILTKMYTYEFVYKYCQIILNLILSIEEDNNNNNNINTIGQVFCNIIILLENMDAQFEGDSNTKINFEKINQASKYIVNLAELDWDKKSMYDFDHYKSPFIHNISCCYNYYGLLLLKENKNNEADFAFEQSKLLYKQLEKQENFAINGQHGLIKKENSNLTKDNLDKLSKSDLHAPIKKPYFDNFSSVSFKTAHSAITISSSLTNGLKITKDNVIYSKFVEVNNKKYKILMGHSKELNCMQIVVYDKSINILKKLFIKFEDFVDFAKKQDMILDSDDEIHNALNRMAKLLYIQNDELYIKDIPFYYTIEDMMTMVMNQY